MPAPPLSVRGFAQSLRWPTARDVALSVKAYIAVAIALAVGFSQNLVNPYWSALTIYIVLLPTESAAVRSKSLFRLIGTVIGAALIVAEVSLFGDQLGILVTAVIATIVLAVYLRGIDRTPANYLFFSAGLTAGVIGLINLMQPLAIFAYATARMAEIMVGILAIAAVDSLIWPVRMTPKFLDTMEDWRRTARSWVTDALGRIDCQPPDEDSRRETRERLRKLSGTVGTIDAQAVQLPYDVVTHPPRKRDLDLIRYTVVRLVADLASIEVWTRALRRIEYKGEGLDRAIGEVSAWVADSRAMPGDECADHAAEADRLIERIGDTRGALASRVDRDALVERGMLSRLLAFVRDWADLGLALEAMQSRRKLPRRLADLARDHKPVRSIDYVAVARDVLPMAVAMSVTATAWYVTAWSEGAGALLFSFVGCAFLIGQPGIVRSAGGMLLWIGISFAFAFLYLFAVLPRVTAFPVLIGALGMALIPLGLLIPMNLAGLLICVFAFAFLSIQNAYSADFAQSLETMAGSLAGLLIAGSCLYVFAYNRARFVARRLVRGLRLDVADIADAHRTPDRERFLGLTIDRLGLFFPEIDKLEGDDPLKHVDMIDELRIGLILLMLRDDEPASGEDARMRIQRLRHRIGAALRDRAEGGRLPTALYDEIGDDIEALRAMDDEPRREHLLESLVGLRFAFAPDASPVGQAIADDRGRDDA